MHIQTLKSFFLPLNDKEREIFASACGTTVGQILQIMYGNRKSNPALAIAIDRESKGLVPCEELCPEADFQYLRNLKPPTSKEITCQT
ncbi:helix-turn-helix domain-containing protein [Acinetobacter bereziniae]|uniref:helix-turn-helix domain-containing protein n=1 Tax=Acinetobacter bereziniae TaxID=106648 RepID=UPI0021D3EB87|nr:helix-turn-helix domain-containing protein [Acinetobacter bereziniae]MCU4436128.1 helix-turn-helix domain-containing protein [Acinetobacter bereziniae]